MTQLQILAAGMRSTWRLLNVRARVLVVVAPIALVLLGGGVAFVGKPSKVSTVVDRSDSLALQEKLKSVTDELDTLQRQASVVHLPSHKWSTRTVTKYQLCAPGTTPTIDSVSVTQTGSENEGSKSTSSVTNKTVDRIVTNDAKAEQASDSLHEKTTVTSSGPLVQLGLGYAPFSSQGLLVAVGASAPIVWKLEVGGLVVVPTAAIQDTSFFLMLGLRP